MKFRFHSLAPLVSFCKVFSLQFSYLHVHEPFIYVDYQTASKYTEQSLDYRGFAFKSEWLYAMLLILTQMHCKAYASGENSSSHLGACTSAKAACGCIMIILVFSGHSPWLENHKLIREKLRIDPHCTKLANSCRDKTDYRDLTKKKTQCVNFQSLIELV